MMNTHHFKATPLGNLLKRTLSVNPYEEEKDDLEVLNEVLRSLNLEQKPKLGAIGYNQV